MVYSNLDELQVNSRAHWLGAMKREAFCISITNPESNGHACFQSMHKELLEHGLRKGQVEFFDPQKYMKYGKLVLPVFLEKLEQKVETGIQQGFRAVDISFDMVSLHLVLQELRDLLQIITNGFLERHPSAILFQFPQDGLPSETFNTLLEFSPFIVLGGRIRRNTHPLPLENYPAKPGNQAREVLHVIEQWNQVMDQNAALFTLLDKHGPALCLVDHQDEIIHWNQAFAVLTGLGQDGIRAPVPFASVIESPTECDDLPSDSELQRRTFSGKIRTRDDKEGPVTLYIHHMPETAGRNFWNRLVVVRGHDSPTLDQDGEDQSELQYRRLFEMSRRGLVRVSAGGVILHVNQTFADMLGYKNQEGLRGQDMNWWKRSCVSANQCRAMFQKFQEHGSVSKYEMEMLAADGQSRLLQFDGFSAGKRDDPGCSFIAVVEDVTEQKSSDQKLLHQAFHDHLTGLPNKALLMDRIDMALQQAKRKKDSLFALAFLDIDNFKTVNDRYGHLLADQLLVKISQVIANSVRNVDTVSRFGGDEFVALLDGIEDESEAMSILNRIREGLSIPFPVNGQRGIVCTVSIGLVLSMGYTSATEMLRDADMAMYKAKTQNKGGIHLLRPTSGRLAHRRDTLMNDISRALDHGEFWLHYQPIYQINGNRIIGFEALIRWKHPKLGLLLPDEFLPLAEKNGQIIPLTHWVLGDACSQMRTWQLNYTSEPPLTISVNLFLDQFSTPGLVESVQSVLEATGLDERSLKLEFSGKALAITENIGELLIRLKELDVQLSIDDFGLGCSALLHLQRYPFVPIDNLKIDRSVIGRLTDSNDYLEMVWTTIMLAHSLGIEVVAEGVETRQQLSLLQEMNCDYAQGYLFSKPLESRLAGKLLHKNLQNPHYAFPRAKNLAPERKTLEPGMYRNIPDEQHFLI
ncbi:EAL domain-containing protein [Desulfonatronum thiosulfatophilum]|nr:EAL domain-containing protein [Desulfonatronum thiosulfatophilum]